MYLCTSPQNDHFYLFSIQPWTLWYRIKVNKRKFIGDYTIQNKDNLGVNTEDNNAVFASDRYIDIHDLKTPTLLYSNTD